MTVSLKYFHRMRLILTLEVCVGYSNWKTYLNSQFARRVMMYVFCKARFTLRRLDRRLDIRPAPPVKVAKRL